MLCCSNHFDEALVQPICTLLTCISSLEVLALSHFDLSNDLAMHLARQPHLSRLIMGRCSLTQKPRAQTHQVSMRHTLIPAGPCLSYYI